MRRGWLDDIAKLNELKLHEFGDPEIATRIAQYEMAFKMQASVPELADLSNEPDADARHVRPASQGAGHLRPQLPDGPAAGRARRPVRAVDARRLGPAQQPDDRAVHPVPRHRPALRRPGQGPEAARPARRHAGHLGRRIRPHAVHPGRHRRSQALGPRPSSLRLHPLDGRRRHQARPDLRRDRRPGHERRPAIRSTSTTFRRRSCTCWASTTNG